MSEPPPPPDQGYHVPSDLPDPGPPPGWWGYLGMLSGSSVPFAAVITLLWLITSGIQRGLSLHKVLDDYFVFFILFLGCLPQLFVVPVAVIAVLRNLQWWLRPSPARQLQANRWRRRFWLAWLIGVCSSVLISLGFFGWTYLTCFMCSID
jgi:hypothetical protein